MSTVEYKGYVIEPYQSAPGRWLARLCRIDGRKIKNLIKDNEEREAVTTHNEVFSEDEAVKLAKQTIDGGGLG